jgi:hypothetical protein
MNRERESELSFAGRPGASGPIGGISPLRADLCHNPLYFEERRPERTGQSRGVILQPVVSGAHFFANVAMLPAKMAVHPPASIVCGDRYFPRGPFLQNHPVPAYAAGTAQSFFWTSWLLLP